MHVSVSVGREARNVALATVSDFVSSHRRSCTPATLPQVRAASLRRLAESWQRALRTASLPQRERQQVRVAIAGACDLASALDGQPVPRHLAQRTVRVEVPRIRRGVAVRHRAIAMLGTGTSYRDVAASLGIPVSTAKTWARRARLGGAA